MRTRLFITSFALVVGFAISACTSMPSTLPSSTVTSLSITGAPPAVGATSQYSATAVLAGSATELNVTGIATWSSDTPTVATVSTTGLIRGVSAGSAKVTVVYNGTS